MILEVRNITKQFIINRGIFKNKSSSHKVLDNINFKLDEFKVLGVVGESGCGKTTLAKIILKLIIPDSGEVLFDEKQIINFRKDAQIIFQNPYNSLNPKICIFDAISEPLIIHRIVQPKYIKDKVIELLRMVKLDESISRRLPIEFSGGQRQRICIARALASEPKFIVLDEPISSLDLTIQAQMLDLFNEIKARLKLTYIFISHNLAVIKKIADDIIVMKEGVIVEQAECDELFSNPRHSYTKFLLASV